MLADRWDRALLLALLVSGRRCRHDGLRDGPIDDLDAAARSRLRMVPSVMTQTASVIVPVSSDHVLMKSTTLTG